MACLLYFACIAFVIDVRCLGCVVRTARYNQNEHLQLILAESNHFPIIPFHFERTCRWGLLKLLKGGGQQETALIVNGHVCLSFSQWTTTMT